MIENIDKCFGFLREYGFKGPIEYNNEGVLYHDYIKGDIVISVGYDGSFWVEFVRTMKIIPALNSGDKKLTDIDSRYKKYFNLKILDPNKRIFNSCHFINAEDKTLWYYSKLLKRNSEILEGDLYKFKKQYRFLKFFGIKKR